MAVRDLRAIVARLVGHITGRANVDLREELQTHVELATAEHIRRGMTPNDARRAALVEAGGVTAATESYREQQGLPTLDRFGQDLRYGFRVLRRAPGFAFIAISAIGFAVGINAGFFTLVDALMLQPRPVANPSRIVKLVGVDASNHANIQLSYTSFEIIAAHASSIEDLVAYYATSVALRTSSTGRATAGSAAMVPGSYFSSLGGRATLGRLLIRSDDEEGAAPVVVISDAMWEQRFSRSPEVVGRDVVINGTHATIVGVASHDFIGINPLVPDLWMPVTLGARAAATPGVLRDPSNRFLALHGRLRAGVNLHRAEAEVSALVADPPAAPGTTAALTRLTGIVLLPNDAMIPLEAETALAAAPGFIIVLLVLVIACANLANLLLSRALARQREIAVRLALGASRGRLLRQLLTECLIIAVIGAVIGMVIAKITVDFLTRSFLANVPTTLGVVALRIQPSWHVLAYTIIITMASVSMFGLAPALQATSRELTSAIKGEDFLFGTQIRRSRFRDALVSAQVAACLVLLAAATTLVKSLRDIATVDWRIELRQVVVAHLGLSAAGHISPSLVATRTRFADRVATLEGVGGSAMVNAPPVSPWPVSHVADANGHAPLSGVFTNIVTPRYFDVVGQRIIAGRAFSAADSASGARVAIVTAAAGRTLWPGQQPLGQLLRIASLKDSVGRIVRVIGVAADARSVMAWDNDSNGYLYLPATSSDLATLDMSVLIRTDKRAPDVGRAVADIASQLDPDAPLTTFRLIDQASMQLLPYEYSALITSGVGALAIALAIFGLYGVVAFAVAQRRREIAIHVAIGATPPDVLALVLRREMRLILRGLVVGFVLSLGESKLLGSLVVPLSSLGIWSIAVLGAGLVVVAVAATILPGLSALRIAPMQVLRQE